MLRSALHKATQAQGAAGLTHGELSRSVFDALDLRFDEYAADPDVRGPARNATHDALRRVIDYYLYRDLQRGWRVTAPNLEDCGLLRFDYEGLHGDDGLLGEDGAVGHRASRFGAGASEEFVETPAAAARAALRSCARSCCAPCSTSCGGPWRSRSTCSTRKKQLDLVEQTKPRLLEGTVWYLEDAASWSSPRWSPIRARERQRGSRRLFVSSYGGYGRYLRALA